MNIVEASYGQMERLFEQLATIIVPGGKFCIFGNSFSPLTDLAVGMIIDFVAQCSSLGRVVGREAIVETLKSQTSRTGSAFLNARYLLFGCRRRLHFCARMQ